MEVRIDVFDHNNKLYCSAYYVMVARDNADGKAKKIPQLSFELEEEGEIRNEAKLRYHLGKKRQGARIEKIKHSLAKEPPQSEESKVIHKFFTDRLERKETKKSLTKKILSINSTRVEKTVLKHYQDRNIHGKIFGGIIMRECLELGFVAANLAPWLKDPAIYFIDDIYFLRPVDIGSLIRYTAYITYCDGCLTHIKVLVEKAESDGESIEYIKATEFNMVLKVSDTQATLVPESYDEAMQYLEARRRVKSLLDLGSF